MFDEIRSEDKGLTQQFVDFLTQAKHEVSIERLTIVANENLQAMKDDVITFGNAIVDMALAGEFKELGTDATWEMKSISFTLRSHLGHFIVATLNAEGGHEIYLGFGANNIELYGLTIESVIAVVKNYNKIQVVTAVGEQLANTYVQPKSQDSVRENE